MSVSRRERTCLFAMLAMSALLGCSASRGGAVGESRLAGPSGTVMTRLVGRSVANAPAIRALPPMATFAWGTPSAAFVGVTAADDSASLYAVADMREDAAAVLRANGWREVDPDSAEYVLAMVRVERTGEQVVMIPDPRNERTFPEPPCDKSTATPQKPCVERAPPNYPPRRDVRMFTDVKRGYAIRRRADGATRWWVMEQMSEEEARRFVARVTVELLLAVEKEGKP